MTNFELLKQTAVICEEQVQGPIKAVLVEFHGLGGSYFEPGDNEREWGKHGVLAVFPYYGPWTWMNREARNYLDELIEAIYEHYQLDSSIPLITLGGSMGGFSALLYTRYAKKVPAACVAMCPVCDLKYHYSERPDLPKTILFTFRGYQEPLEELFVEHSPVCQVDQMPDIPYIVFHGTADRDVSKQAHSDVMVAAMKQRGLQVEYIELEDCGHCQMPEQAVKTMNEFIYNNL